MRFTPLAIAGVWLVRLEPRVDTRGYFARSFCREEFSAHGLPDSFPQGSLSFNARRGTLRGLHWQDEAAPEGKLVRCTRGSAFDVAADTRPGSASYGRWIGLTLDADTADAIYIPPGVAHGFQTLQDATELSYQMTEPYRPGMERGVRWDDPTLAVTWPVADPILSERDGGLPLL